MWSWSKRSWLSKKSTINKLLNSWKKTRRKAKLLLRTWPKTPRLRIRRLSQIQRSRAAYRRKLKQRRRESPSDRDEQFLEKSVKKNDCDCLVYLTVECQYFVFRLEFHLLIIFHCPPAAAIVPANAFLAAKSIVMSSSNYVVLLASLIHNEGSCNSWCESKSSSQFIY